jgi:hypothetical protein
MNPVTYNISLVVGLVLIGSGTAMISVPAALIVTGTLLLGLTFMTASLSGRGKR